MAASAASNLAILIDADNAQATAIAEILGEVARYGTATVKRAYGDWTTQNLASWKNVLHVHAVQPIQQFSYTKGKNATDSALIMDAMDLLHGGKVDGFCLVSSDSDFTRLATRIREAGLSVYGFGERKTPQPFVAVCDKFVFTEILGEPAKKSTPRKLPTTKIRELLEAAISSAVREDGWAFLGAVGSLVNKNDPSFDSRNFGYKKLGDLVRDQYVGNEPRPLRSQSAPAKMNHDVDALSEEEIKIKFNDWLQSEAWVTEVAWGRTPGIDIVARRNGKRWIIEVKGPGSRSPMRVNYFIGILGETLQRMDNASARYTSALADLKQYRGLWERLPDLAKQRTAISLLLMSKTWEIQELR